MEPDIDPAEVCDCAPTAKERRALWPSLTRRRALTLGAIGLAAAASVGAFGQSQLARAEITYDPDDYPTWDDVQAAKDNEANKASEISRIEAMIADLKARVAEAQAAAQKAGEEYFAAQQAYAEASYRADQLQAQADEQSKKADEATAAAALVAQKLTRADGDDTSLEVLFSGSSDDADALLSQLGQMDKLVERNQAVYDEAVKARDSAQSLSDQAKVARDERDRLQKIANEKMIAAQNAQAAAEQALADQQANLTTLEAQLAALKDTTSKTVADYEAGVKQKAAYDAEQERLAEERRKKEEEERQQREEEERKQAEEAANSGGDSSSDDSSTTPASTGSSGWVRPNWGVETAGYGYRTQICNASYCSSSFHEGVDLADSCGTAIYAAHSGTVIYAGYYGGYGNYIKIDNGDGYGTGYGHILDGGIAVSTGQWVEAGEVIAYEGNTGNSFGCHLHFEVYQNGATIDPAAFMATVGISV
ncbi:MAG: M23 family metallopeptidase [Microbacterium sp.]